MIQKNVRFGYSFEKSNGFCEKIMLNNKKKMTFRNFLKGKTYAQNCSETSKYRFAAETDH